MERLDYHELVVTILKQYSDIFVGEGTEVQRITDRGLLNISDMISSWNRE